MFYFDFFRFPEPEIKISLNDLLPQEPVLISLLDTPQSPPLPGNAGDFLQIRERSATRAISRKSDSRKKRGGDRKRRQSTTTVYYIDVVAVVDYGAYRRFLDGSASRTEALEAIREYYSFIFNGVCHLSTTFLLLVSQFQPFVL